MNSARELLKLIESKQLFPLFQPIIDTAEEYIIGYEALIRGPQGHPLEFPDALFSAAQQHDLLSELELACREAAIREFLLLDTDARLFLNVNPNVLQDSDHPHGTTLRISQQLGIDPRRIVIELSERYPIQQPELLKEAVLHYQQLGFLVAIDDLGAGYSGLKLWSEIKPDFVKIDRYFISDLNNQPTKREFVQSITSLARKVNAKVIAEGIETIEEFHQLHHLNLFLCQGFLFARPTKNPPQTLPVEHLLPQARNTIAPNPDTIASVTRDAITLSPFDKAHNALELFSNRRTLCSIPIVDNGKAVGMLRRESLMELFSGSYGRALYANKEVSRVMDSNPVVVDCNTPIDTVSTIITDDDDVDIFREFIVTQKQQFLGVASVRDLLKRITELRIQNARYANPLTLLPGNVPIHQHLDELLAARQSFAIAYFDINHFKPFNDNYGYAKGDEVIRQLGQLLVQYADSPYTFIGHIGGDDFVVIFRKTEVAEVICKQVIDAFEQHITTFYSTQDKQRGYVLATGRNGQQQSFPLTSLAVGLVIVSADTIQSHHQVAALASEAKKQAKQESGSYCYVDCR